MIHKLFKIKYVLVALCILFLSLYFNNPGNKNSENSGTGSQILPPKPVDFRKRKNKHIDRDAYIEQMHRAAPDVDWKEMDAKTRKLKFLKKQRIIESGNFLKSGTIESFADGKITGTWHEKGSKNLAGRMMLADYDSEKKFIYSASAGGVIWRSDLNGNWQSLNDLTRFDDIKSIRLLKQDNTTRILVFHGDKYHGFVSYSDNEGGTWNDAIGLSGVEEWGTIKRGVVLNDEDNTVYVLAAQWNFTEWKTVTVLYKSVNGGADFQNVCEFSEGELNNVDIWTDDYSSTDLYAMVTDSLYKFSEGELQFISKVDIVEKLGNVLLNGRLSGTNIHLYVAFSSNTSNNTWFYRSIDGGLNWEKRGNVDHLPFYLNSLEVSALNTNVVYWGATPCFVSTDGGTTWRDFGKYEYINSAATELHWDIPGINSFIDNVGREFAIISTDGGSYISYDQLQTVKNISLSGQNVSQYYSLYTSESNTEVIFAGSQDQGLQRSNNENNGKREFDQIWTGDYGSMVSTDKGKTLWAIYPGAAYFFSDAEYSGFGENILGWGFQGGGYIWIPPTCALPSMDGIIANMIYIGGGSFDNNGDAHLIELKYTGSDITGKELPFNFRTSEEASNGAYASISAIAISDLDNDYKFVLTSTGNFFYSTGWEIWEKTQNFTGPTPNHMYGTCILPSPVNKERVYISGSGYSNSPVYVSNDHGVTFSPINNGLPNTLVFELDCNPDESMVFAATEVGPYVYFPSEDMWYELDGLTAPDQTYWCVEYIEELKLARFGTYGRGIWDFAIENNSVNINPIIQESSTFQITKVYPNPCRDKVKLNIYITNPSEINISILDIQGKGLVSGIKKLLIAGENEIEIDLQHIPSGIYFINSSTGDGNTVVNKIVKVQ
ncbi:MAG: T9SS type A sorting domain-containing protein [Bacteroidales bacterium]|nr:T9SS type A sorting domain-containing protein [Bacteroidales bacterium]